VAVSTTAPETPGAKVRAAQEAVRQAEAALKQVEADKAAAEKKLAAAKAALDKVLSEGKPVDSTNVENKD
jgi:outer membrane protein TolC